MFVKKYLTLMYITLDRFKIKLITIVLNNRAKRGWFYIAETDKVEKLM